MTVERIDQGTILVSLCDEDMRRYSLCFDESASATAGLKSLLSRVGEMCGLDHRGKSYLVEALPSPKGCLLIISIRTVKRRRVYRIKRQRARQLCVFFHADAMLDYFTAVICRKGSHRDGYDVYRYQGRYVLLPAFAVSERVTARLSEYGELYPVSEAVFARIREHGELLLSSASARCQTTDSSDAI